MTFESLLNNIRLKLWRSKVLWLVSCEPMNHTIANNICGDFGLLHFIILIEIILKDYHFNMIILIVLRGVAGSRCRAAINGNLIVRCSSPKMWGNVNWNQRHLARVKAYECSQCKYCTIWWQIIWRSTRKLIIRAEPKIQRNFIIGSPDHRCRW